MTTNQSISLLASSLLNENSKGAHFRVDLEPAEDLERVAVQLQQMGCNVKRHLGARRSTAYLECGLPL
jgi:hypothetical protein